MKLAQRLMMGQSGGGLWSPSEISGIVLFDALDSTNITLVGQKVSAWADMFGAGVSAAQGTDAARPTMGAGELTFDGGDSLTIASSTGLAWVKALHSTGGMVVALARFFATSDPDAACSLCGNNGSSSGNYVGFCLFFDDRSSLPRNNNLVVLVGRAQPTTSVITFSVNNTVPPNQYNLIDMLLDPDNAARIDMAELSVNGGDIVKNNTGAVSAVTSNATYNLQIGASGNNVLPLVGAIKSIAFVPSVLSSTDRQKLVGWMAHRHSETALLPAGHPYKTTAP